MAAMPKRLIQRHDEFAKHLLDQPGNADAFVRERLPSTVAACLSAKPVIDRSESHVDPKLRALRGDRVYSAETTSGDDILIWTMIEHKSDPETDILKQLLTDLAGLAAKGASKRPGPKGNTLLVPAPVYALILYHGTGEWNAPSTLSDAYGLPADLAARGLLSFTYTLVDLLTIPDEALSAHPPLQAALLVLKYALYDGDPLATLERLMETAVHLGLTTLIVVVNYLAKESDWADVPTLRRLVAHHLPGEEDTVMGLAAEQIIDEARPVIMAETLLRQLKRKFGVLPEQAVTRVHAADVARLEIMSDAILDAQTLEDVLGQIPKGGDLRARR